MLERLEKGEELPPLLRAEVAVGFLRGLRFAAVPEDGFFEVAGAAVVQEVGVLVDKLDESDSPEGRRAPFPAGGLESGALVSDC